MSFSACPVILETRTFCSRRITAFGRSSGFAGTSRPAAVHADAGLSIYDEIRHTEQRFLYLGHDPAVCALSIKAILQCLLGHPMQASVSEREAIALARRLRHMPSLAHALWFVCQAQVVRGDAPAVADTANELLTLSEEHGMAQTRAAALAYLGWAKGQTKDVDQGLEYLTEGLQAWRGLGLRSNLCFSLCLLAETYFAGRRYNEGLKTADLAIATSSEIGDRWCLPTDTYDSRPADPTDLPQQRHCGGKLSHGDRHRHLAIRDGIAIARGDQSRASVARPGQVRRGPSPGSLSVVENPSRQAVNADRVLFPAVGLEPVLAHGTGPIVERGPFAAIVEQRRPIAAGGLNPIDMQPNDLAGAKGLDASESA